MVSVRIQTYILSEILDSFRLDYLMVQNGNFKIEISETKIFHGFSD